jgi:hypothetical protein
MSTIDYRDPSLLVTIHSNGLMSSDDKVKLNGIVLDGYTTKTYVDGYASSIKLSVTEETNRAMAAEYQIRQALDGYSGSSATDGYATKAYVDGYAESIKEIISAETNRAISEENVIKTALDGYGSFGAMQTIRFAIGIGATQSSVSSIPANAVVKDCMIRIDTSYSPGTTISVGRSGSIALVQMIVDNDPTTVGLYQAPQDTLWSILGQVQVTVGGSPGIGGGYCSVNYVVANV